MELHHKIYFDFLLSTAVERFTERVIARTGGTTEALEAIRQTPEGEGVWLGQFVNSFFEDMLLNNTAGAVFVLEALERRSVEAQAAGKLDEVLGRMARQAFRQLLWEKSQEALEQSVAYY
jgi:hypothetical protein